MTEPTTTADAGHRAGLTLLLVVGCPLLVLVAVGLEVLGGQYANSDVPGWASLVPLSWPQAARAVWWTVVAAAAGGFRLGLARLGLPQRPLAVGLTVAPFALFALGVATGSSATTWH